MNGNLSGVTDDLVVFIYISGPKIYQDVDDKHDVNNEIDDCERVAVLGAFTSPFFRRSAITFVEQKSGDIRGADSGVENKDENDPVPDCLEGRVVKNRTVVNTRHLQLVLW